MPRLPADPAPTHPYKQAGFPAPEILPAGLISDTETSLHGLIVRRRFHNTCDRLFFSQANRLFSIPAKGFAAEGIINFLP